MISSSANLVNFTFSFSAASDVSFLLSFSPYPLGIYIICSQRILKINFKSVINKVKLLKKWNKIVFIKNCVQNWEIIRKETKMKMLRPMTY